MDIISIFLEDFPFLDEPNDNHTDDSNSVWDHFTHAHTWEAEEAYGIYSALIALAGMSFTFKVLGYIQPKIPARALPVAIFICFVLTLPGILQYAMGDNPFFYTEDDSDNILISAAFLSIGLGILLRQTFPIKYKEYERVASTPPPLTSASDNTDAGLRTSTTTASSDSSSTTHTTTSQNSVEATQYPSNEPEPVDPTSQSSTPTATPTLRNPGAATRGRSRHRLTISIPLPPNPFNRSNSQPATMRAADGEGEEDPILPQAPASSSTRRFFGRGNSSNPSSRNASPSPRTSFEGDPTAEDATTAPNNTLTFSEKAKAATAKTANIMKAGSEKAKAAANTVKAGVAQTGQTIQAAMNNPENQERAREVASIAGKAVLSAVFL